MADPVLRLGATGSAVVAIQEGLNQFEGFDFPITGTYDATTQAAVTQFQKIVGLPADGVAGQNTWDALRAAIAQLQQQQAQPPGEVQPGSTTFPTPGAVEMDPLDVSGQRPPDSSSMMLWLGAAAIGAVVYFNSRKKKTRAGPGQPLLAGANDAEDDGAENSWEDRARATRRRMRRTQMIFGPERNKKPSGGTQIKNANRKPTFKVRSEESARQGQRKSPARDERTDTRVVDEDLWLTQKRGAPRGAGPVRHAVVESTFKSDPERFRKYAQERSEREGRSVSIVSQKNGRVLYKFGAARKARKARKLGSMETDRLLDEPAIIAESGSVVDCMKAATLLSKRRSLVSGEQQRKHFKRVVRAVADACRGEAAEAVARVVEREQERRDEIEEDLPPVVRAQDVKRQNVQAKLMTDLLDTAAHHRREGRREGAAHVLKRAGKKYRVSRHRDAAKPSGYRTRKTELE